MKFTELSISGVFLIELEKLEDSRGFFARSWCTNELNNLNLDSSLVQCNISVNHQAGTIRGMHYQAHPHEEVKIVRCTMGSIWDAALDIRPKSPTYKQWISVELSAENRNMLYIPKGLAHGFQTLTDNAEVFYQMSTLYAPEYARGLRWNDPAFEINWPIEEIIISDKDKMYEDFDG